MNNTPRPVPGSRRTAVANAYAAARRIAERDAAATKRRSALSAMAAVHAASQKAPEYTSAGAVINGVTYKADKNGRLRDSKGRFAPKSV